MNPFKSWSRRKLLTASKTTGKLPCGADVIWLDDGRAILKCECMENQNGNMLTHDGVRHLICKHPKELFESVKGKKK